MAPVTAALCSPELHFFRQNRDFPVLPPILHKMRTMKEDEAVKLFHGKEGYNCAQAIVATFSKTDVAIEEYKKFGGGRAPENICGAAYAGLTLLDDAQAGEYRKTFETRLGALTCKGLKRNRVPCKECVRTSAEILNTIL